MVFSSCVRSPRGARITCFLLLIAFACHGLAGLAFAEQRPLSSSENERLVARRALAIAYFQAQLLPHALTEVDLALGVAPFDPDTLALKALFLQHQNRPQSAEALYLQAQALAPLSVSIAHNFGLFYCQFSRFDQAETQFKRALTHSEGFEHDKTAWARGLCLLQNDQFQAADGVLSSVLDRRPAFIFDSLKLVSLKMKLGSLEEAEKILNNFNDSPSVSAQSLGLSIVLAQGQNQTDKKLHWAKLLGLHFSNSAQWRAYQEGTLHD